MRTIATAAAIIAALEIVKWTIGAGPALFIASVGLALCIGILFGAGSREDAPTPEEQHQVEREGE